MWQLVEHTGDLDTAADSVGASGVSGVSGADRVADLVKMTGSDGASASDGMAGSSGAIGLAEKNATESGGDVNDAGGAGGSGSSPPGSGPPNSAGQVYSSPRRRRARHYTIISTRYILLIALAVIVGFPIYITVVNSLISSRQIAARPPVLFPLHPLWGDFSAAFSQDFTLPPLMFSEEEIEALALGARWVADRGDAGLGEAVRNALAKIGAVLPAERRMELETSPLLVGPGATLPAGDLELPLIRAAIRAERKLDIVYRDLKDRESARTLWPFALGYFDRVRVMVAWCELRREFRHFRVDRVLQIKLTESRYPRRRLALLKAWRQEQGLAEP